MDVEFEESGIGFPLQITESEVDLEKVAEMEYERMKRQYFLMQKNRHSVMEKAGSKQVRCIKLVKILELQRDNLESELTAATSPLNQKRDLATKEKIWELLQIYEQYKAQAKNFAEEIEVMQKTVIKMTSKFYKTKLHLQAIMGCAIPLSRMEKTIENNENKLHMIKSNYDTLMTENRALKDEISLKINRRFVIFQRMEKLHRRMHEIQTDLHSSVDQAIQVYNIWDDAHQKINFIKEKHKDENRSHALQMKEYDRLLFHDIRELRFYSTKNKPRQLMETSDIRDARKAEQELRQLLKQVRKYQHHFRRLEEFDPLQNEQSVIYTYKALEQQNFAHFNRLTDCNKEVTHLMEEIHDLKTELDELVDERKARDTKNTQELARLETIRDTESESLNHLKKQLNISQEALERIVVAVEAFFQTAECSLEPLQETLGFKEEITTRDLRHAFNILEHHIAAMQLEKELLQIQSSHESKSISVVQKPHKVPKASGGPYEPTLVISGRPELGMERKGDEEEVIFAATPIPKTVQRENLLTQLRDLGIVSKKKSPTRLTQPYPTYTTKYKRKPLPKLKKSLKKKPESTIQGEPKDDTDREDYSGIQVSKSMSKETTESSAEGENTDTEEGVERKHKLRGGKSTIFKSVYDAQEELGEGMFDEQLSNKEVDDDDESWEDEEETEMTFIQPPLTGEVEGDENSEIEVPTESEEDKDGIPLEDGEESSGGEETNFEEEEEEETSDDL